MNAIELKERDPKRFEKEYQKWAEHALYDEWWDCVHENFTTDCAAMGIRVDDITFSGFWSQGDGAAFAGRLYVYEWMEGKGYHITHPAAYLACKEDGSYVSLETGRGNSMQVSMYEHTENTEPSGIFAGLDQYAWEQLVEDQLYSLSVEDEVLSFCEELASVLYNDLLAEYEHLTSEETFIEHCEANEVTFEENEDAIST